MGNFVTGSYQASAMNPLMPEGSLETVKSADMSDGKACGIQGDEVGKVGWCTCSEGSQSSPSIALTFLQSTQVLLHRALCLSTALKGLSFNTQPLLQTTTRNNGKMIPLRVGWQMPDACALSTGIRCISFA